MSRINPHALRFDRELIERYDGRGPRYTSYPTAMQFEESFTEDEYRRHALVSNASGRPLSLYVHIPFCKTLCYYCACNKIVTRNKERVQKYMRHLNQEIDMQSDDGLLEVDENEIRVTPSGRLLLRSIAMVFDRHLSSGATDGRFSKAI